MEDEDKILDDIDKANVGSELADAFAEPFEADNLSKSMFEAMPSVFDDQTFGGFNRTVVGGAVDALDLGLRTIESGVKGGATAINEAKNYITGQDDDRLKRDILNFFITAGVGSATSGPTKIRQGINQLIKSGKKDEAAKVILAESDAFKKDNFKQVMAMTAKRESSPARKMTETERALRNKRIEKDREEFRIRTFGYDPNKTDNIVDTSYRMQHQPRIDGARLDDITGGGTYFPEDVYSAQGLRYYGNPNNKAEVLNYNIIKSVRGKPDAEVTIYRGVPDDSKITTINEGDFVTLNKKYAEDHASSGYGFSGQDAGKVISKKVKVKDVVSDGNDLNEFGYFPTKKIKEAQPLEIGVSKYNIENADKLLKNYNIDDFKNTQNASSRSRSGLGASGDKKINAFVEEGKEVSVRLNLNSRIDPDGPKAPFNHMQTIHPVIKGKPNYKQSDSYKTAVSLEKGTFHIDQNLRRKIAEEGMKVPAMSVQGKYTTKRNVFDEMDDSVVEIGTNPKNSHLFIDLKTGQAVKGFDLATVFRDRVYAKGVTYWKKVDAPKPLPAKGDVPIENQVRFKMKRGGLMARV